VPKRLRKGEKNGQKRLACVGGVYSVARFRRTADDALNEILRKQKQTKRPKPRTRRLRARLTRKVDGRKVNAKDGIFDWLAQEVDQRDPRERRTVVAVIDGETKRRDLQELTIGRAISILDIWHLTEYLWKLAACFHPEGSNEAEAAGPPSDGMPRIATDLMDVPAEVIAEIFRNRWAVEIFFRFFKHILGCRHLIRQNPVGVEIQSYCGLFFALPFSGAALSWHETYPPGGVAETRHSPRFGSLR